MKKPLKVIGNICLIFTTIYGFTLILKMQKLKKAQAITDSVIENLVSEDVYKEFPKKHFSREQLEPLIGEIKANCDWKNRDGIFVNYFTEKYIKGVDQTAFIYEYYLDCDSLRFILSVNMENEPELVEFIIEPIEKNNQMISPSTKQLINR